MSLPNEFSSINPANGQVVWKGVEATKEQINTAFQVSEKAFCEWSQKGAEERYAFLQRYQDILKQNQAALAETIAQETGKPLWDCKNEVASMIAKVSLTWEAYQKRCPPVERQEGSRLSITRHRPHGVTAVLGPFNFPGHLPTGHILPALLAGNTVIFKPSELTPGVGEMLQRFFNEAELPHGVIQLLQGGKNVGIEIVQHPLLKGLFFTGSYAAGLALSKHFGQTPEKILALEMGGNNPLVVSQIEDVQAAAYLTVQSAYLSSGQRCTCARRLIVPRTKLGDDFLEALLSLIKKIQVGPYTDIPEPFMGPVISTHQAESLLNAQKNIITQGGIPLIEMKQLKEGTPFLTPGLMDVTAVKELPDEENFGPFLQLIRTTSFEEAVEEANRTQFGLSAGLFSDSPKEYDYFLKNIRAGIVNWNAPLTGASSAAPFGGVGRSGNHRPSAYYAVDYCSHPIASIETPQLRWLGDPLPGLPISKNY